MKNTGTLQVATPAERENRVNKNTLAWLEKQGTRRTREEMARYGIAAKRAFGVPMGTLLKLRKRLGTDHELSLALWESGWYEARLLAALVGDPQRVTRRQMNTWAASFENWGDCDTVCFKLFDRTPFAWEKARQWAASPHEFVKRGGFALMACLALHDKPAPDKRFLAFLPLIETGARDERNFVKKGVSWALRSIGRRNKALNSAALKVAKRLALSEEAACRWVGNDAVRELCRFHRPSIDRSI
jgi:3-methyladenine DNA glycosylase AlkD